MPLAWPVELMTWRRTEAGASSRLLPQAPFRHVAGCRLRNGSAHEVTPFLGAFRHESRTRQLLHDTCLMTIVSLAVGGQASSPDAAFRGHCGPLRISLREPGRFRAHARNGHFEEILKKFFS